MLGNSPVQEAYEGRLSGQGAQALSAGEAGRRLIDTLRRRWARRVIVGPAKRARGVRVKARARPLVASPGRLKPKGASSRRWTNPPSYCQEPLEGLKPRNRGSSGPAHRFGVGTTGERNGRWVHPVANPAGYLPGGERSEG